jgi:hypothetical protein
MKLNIDVDTKQLMQDITDDLVDEEGLIKELTMKGESYCKKECPKDTGDLSRSITSDLSRGVVKTDLEYAKYVILGTSAHIITIKKKKVLSDINSGSTKKKNAIYGTSVRHPGTSANNFPARAVNQIKGEIPAIVKKYLRLKK